MKELKTNEQREKEKKIYDRGWLDGCMTAKNKADVEYAGKLADITGAEAFQELANRFEREKTEAIYKAYKSVYHYICAIAEAMEASKWVDMTLRDLIYDVRAEIESEYLIASDDYHAVTYEDEDFAARCAAAEEKKGA